MKSCKNEIKSKMNLMFFRLTCVTLLAGSQVGCKEKVTLSGVWENQGEKTYAVAYANPKDWVNEKHFHQVKFDLYQAVGTADKIPVTASYISKPSIQNGGDRVRVVKVEFGRPIPGIGKEPIEARVTSRDKKNNRYCAARDTGIPAQLCWDQESFWLMVGTHENRILTLRLRKGAEFVEPIASEKRKFTLDEAMGRARFSAYDVQQEAEKVKQARDSVHNARGMLLPQLSAASIITATVFPMSGYGAVSLVQSGVPFLIPSNWFREQAAKETARAQEESFKALQANKMLMVQSSFYAIHRDRAMIEVMNQHLEYLKDLQKTVNARGALAGTDSALWKFQQDINIHEILLDALSSTVKQEKFNFVKELSFAPIQNEDLDIEQLTFKEPDLSEKINGRDLNRIVQKESFELATIRHLRQAARKNEKVAEYSFIDPTNYLRLDFGYNSRIRITKSATRALELSEKNTADLLQARSEELAEQYNRALRYYQQLKISLANYEVEVAALKGAEDRTSLPEDLEKAYHSLSSTRLSLIDLRHNLATMRATYDRLTLSGPYEHLKEPNQKADTVGL